MYGLFVLLIYTALMIGATFLISRKPATAESFHVADRKLGLFQSAMSIAATWIWAPALFTSAEKAYTHGWPGLFWFLVPNVLCLLLFVPFARKMREQMPDGVTVSGYMAERYQSKSVHGVYLFELSALTVLSTAVQLLAGAKMLSAVTGWPFWLLTIALSLIAYSYSQYSGIRASVLTDAVQMLLMLGCCALLVPLSLHGSGPQSLVKGLSGFTGEFTHLLDRNGLTVLLGFGLPSAIGLLAAPFGDQCFWQRAFSIRKDKLSKAFRLGAVLFAVVPLSMGLLGFIAAGSGFTAADTGMVGFELVKSIFPAWIMLPFLFMLISGLLSTVDSNLCAAASLTSDWQVTGKLENAGAMRVSRLAMVGLLIVSNLIANIPGLSVTGLFLFYGALRSTTMLPTILTLKGKHLTAKGVTAGVISSMLVGMPVFILGTITGNTMLKTAGSLCAVLLSGIISLAISYRGEVRA